jgi:hypothetical protein
VDSSDKRFVKFPTSFVEFVVIAKLTECQNKMLHAVVRYCHGFHKPDRVFNLADLNLWLGWHRRSIQRTAEELVQRQIFSRESHAYRMQNDAQKWQREWEGRAVDKSVDNPVDKSNQGALPGTEICAQNPTFMRPWAQLSTGDEAPDLTPQSASNVPNQKEDSPFPDPRIVDLCDWLKISLKKERNKEIEEPDPDLKKRKLEIFKEMSRSKLWSDNELVELAKTLGPDELAELHAGRRAVGE